MNERVVRDLAKGLGWAVPAFYSHEHEPAYAVQYGWKNTVWAVSEISPSFFFQVNLRQMVEHGYRLAVYAIRFRICSGWRDIELYPDVKRRRQEIERVTPYFHFRHFETPKSRRNYREMYPYVRDFTWKRIQQEGALHF